MKEFLIWERDLDEKLTCRTIPYDTMVLAYPEAYDEKTGEMTAPEIQDDQDFAEMLRMISLYKNLNPQCYD